MSISNNLVRSTVVDKLKILETDLEKIMNEMIL